MANSSPKISVLLPVYNSTPYLRDSLESLLAQTFTDFEIIAVDDGSSDESASVVQAYAKNESRLRFFQNEKNIGLSATLNRASQEAAGLYLARHDGDDIALPERFEKQSAFLDANPDVGVLGCQVEIIDQNGKPSGAMTFPTEHNAIAWAVFWDRPFAHPSVMMRREVLEEAGAYRPEFDRIEDIDLWMRMLPQTRFANLPSVLERYRIHPTSICQSNRGEQPRMAAQRKSEFVREAWGLEAPKNIFDTLKTPRTVRPDIPARVFIEYQVFLAEMAERMEREGILLTDAAPSPRELVARTTRVLSRCSEISQADDLLEIGKKYLPRWLFRLVRSYLRRSSKAAKLFPDAPAKSPDHSGKGGS
ncbi:MAG: glycosyltransferase [Candidatus Sumerlaeota bacterium]